MEKQKDSKVLATLHIHDAADMSDKEVRRTVEWLRRHARTLNLKNHRRNYDKRFTARIYA